MIYFPVTPKRKKILRILAVVACVLLVVVLVAWLAAPAVLTVDSGVQRVNAEVVLGGEPWTRPLRGADVYAESKPSLVIVSGNGDCEDVRRQMMAKGVPASVIVTECESRNTKENASCSVKLLRARGVTNVVIVTSWYHSRRALACFQQAAPEMTFYSRPALKPPGKSFWPDRYERHRVRQEYAKILYYWITYGVPPFV